jgi:class 3 adenylate cyclase
VIAGVIGKRKFIYDLWGDTVNTASRMESSGVIQEIQVSQQVYERLVGKFVFEPRGMIKVKGKGELETYLLKGKLLGAGETAPSGYEPSMTSASA